jgi:hypothetical protein
MKQNNYEIARNQMRPLFLTFDQQEMIRKFRLNHDADYLYIRFCGRPYRISRTSGIVEWSEDGFVSCTEGDFNESMTVYDVLCYSRPELSLSGEYAPSSSLPGLVYTGMQAGSSFSSHRTEIWFDSHFDLLEQACKALGGVPEGKGDLAYRIPLFDFLPVRFSFWRADEEFPPEIRLLWDKNVLNYMHFETLFYAAGHLLGRMEEWIAAQLS